MKKYVRLVLGIVLACITLTAAGTAATEQDKMTAIQNGLANLATLQQPDGSWSYGGYEQAATAAALLAFTSQIKNWPAADHAAYQVVVNNAVAYLLANASTITVSTRDDGVNICPGGSGSCTGVYWYGAGESTYTTGLVASGLGIYAAGNAGAVATTSGPLAGMTWTQIAQGITNVFAASQASAIDGNRDGGWRYFIPGNGDADSSTTQWAVLSLIFDESLGATTPGTVKDHLKNWLAVAQAADGSGCYQPGSFCDNSDTGSVLLGLDFVGNPLSNAAVQSALGFLNSAWPTLANNTWFGDFGHPYAMWSDYKALEVIINLTDTTYITNLFTDCGYGRGHAPGNPPGSVPCNWWEDYNEWLVLNQAGDGSWPGYAYWTPPLSTAWDISILGAALIPVSTCDFHTVYLDSRHKCSFKVRNNTTSTVAITGISITPGPGTDANAYSYFAYCKGTLGPGKSCVIQVFFYADAVGALTANLNISSNGPLTPQQASLAGNVIDPVAQFSPHPLRFGRQAVGSSATLPLLLTNTGLTSLAIDNFAISGDNPGDFSQTNNCPAALTPAVSCTIEVTFAPLAKGCPRSAVLTFTDNVKGGIRAVVLSGSAH